MTTALAEFGSLVRDMAWASHLSSGAADAIGGLGFPRGQIGDVATFATEEEAHALAIVHGRLGRSHDVATPLHELHFSVEVYSHYDGQKVVLYDGGQLGPAQAMKALFVGWARDWPGSNYWVCTLKCRGAASGLRLPRPEPDEARKSLAGGNS